MKSLDSVFNVLAEEGLTTLEIFYNRQEDKFTLRGMKEWEESVRWDKYMVEFTHEDILTDDYRSVGTKALVRVFSNLGLEDYLRKIENLLREGKHHGIEFYHNHRLNIRVMYCKSVNALGIRNKRHAIRAGGIRRHEPDEAEIDVLMDGLNLARAMAYKNALAGIPYGGSKILVQCAPVDLSDFEVLGFLAYIIDRTRSFTGPDIGFEPAMTDIMRQRFTNSITGGTKSPLGPTGGVTAYGGYLAIKEASDFVYGSPSLAGKRIAIQGLGACGYPLAEYLLREGATLIVSDIDKSQIDKLQRAWNTDVVKSVQPEDIYAVTADIFSPCAVGGIITEDMIGKFKFDIIMGLANNQIRATSRYKEIEIARQLARASILFVVEWTYNIGGVLAGWAEYIFGEEASFAKIKPRIELICGDNLRKLLDEAKRVDKTPTELIYDKVENALYLGIPFNKLLYEEGVDIG
ncbi:MAG: Glu/Leu/Phe/Val dehydrogenase dimerization domain-containing protein [Dehalococcoidia bacterium]